MLCNTHFSRAREILVMMSSFRISFGQGICGMYHFKDSVSEDLCVIGHGMQKVNAREGIAIGNHPCEFHKDYPDFY